MASLLWDNPLLKRHGLDISSQFDLLVISGTKPQTNNIRRKIDTTKSQSSLLKTLFPSPTILRVYILCYINCKFQWFIVLWHGRKSTKSPYKYRKHIQGQTSFLSILLSKLFPGPLDCLRANKFVACLSSMVWGKNTCETLCWFHLGGGRNTAGITARVSMEVIVTTVSKLVYDLFTGLTTFLSRGYNPLPKYQQDIPVSQKFGSETQQWCFGRGTFYWILAFLLRVWYYKLYTPLKISSRPWNMVADGYNLASLLGLGPILMGLLVRFREGSPRIYWKKQLMNHHFELI